MRFKIHFSAIRIVVTLTSIALLLFALGGDKAAASFKKSELSAEKAVQSIPISRKDSEGEAPEALAPLVLNLQESPSLILSAYRDPVLEKAVILFFEDLIGYRRVAEVILLYSSEFDVSPALAFALSWEESRYNSKAINHNKNDTVDRGLFQLNNASFPQLPIDDFYDPAISARYGISHLRWCLDATSSEVAALAMYNAGMSRISSSGAPKHTLNYVSRILKRERSIDALFEERFPVEYAYPAMQEALVNGTDIQTSLYTFIFNEDEDESKRKSGLFRLSLLTPPRY